MWNNLKDKEKIQCQWCCTCNNLFLIFALFTVINFLGLKFKILGNPVEICSPQPPCSTFPASFNCLIAHLRLESHSLSASTLKMRVKLVSHTPLVSRNSIYLRRVWAGNKIGCHPESESNISKAHCAPSGAEARKQLQFVLAAPRGILLCVLFSPHALYSRACQLRESAFGSRLIGK